MILNFSGFFPRRRHPPGVGLREGALRRFAGNSDVKRQPLMQLNLLVEKGNGLRGVETDLPEYLLRVFLEFRLDPGSDHCALTHTSAFVAVWAVAQTGHKPPVFRHGQ